MRNSPNLQASALQAILGLVEAPTTMAPAVVCLVAGRPLLPLGLELLVSHVSYLNHSVLVSLCLATNILLFDYHRV